MHRISFILIRDDQLKVVSLNRQQLEPVKVVSMTDGEHLMQKLRREGFSQIDNRGPAVVYAKHA